MDDAAAGRAGALLRSGAAWKAKTLEQNTSMAINTVLQAAMAKKLLWKSGEMLGSQPKGFGKASRWRKVLLAAAGSAWPKPEPTFRRSRSLSSPVVVLSPLLTKATIGETHAAEGYALRCTLRFRGGAAGASRRVANAPRGAATRRGPL